MQLHFHFSLSCIGEGNGNPLQYSCLENPRDGGAWWAAVYGVTQSWTRLKRLSSSSSSVRSSLILALFPVKANSTGIAVWPCGKFISPSLTPGFPCPWDSPGKNTRVGCHFLLQCMKVKSESEVAQSCPTLRNPLNCSLPGSSIHGIFQARVLE